MLAALESDRRLPVRHMPQSGAKSPGNIFSEVGYRFLYTDYDTTSLIYQVAMHGAQITVGLKF